MSRYGEFLHLTIFGQSHAPAIGMILEGLPAGETIDMAALQTFLDRRAPGRNDWSTPRKEADQPEFLSGLVGNVTCGAPLTAIIRNTNTRSGDYDGLSVVPRPGHADYTAQVKYHGFQDSAGGGHFSGRLTAPLCIAGGLCKQWLETQGIRIAAHIASIEHVDDMPFEPMHPQLDAIQADFPVLDPAAGAEMREAVARARQAQDSVGGVVECAAVGLPAGLGEPMFGGVENRIAQIVYGIPAVKGVEFGIGFAAVRLRGSQNNDGFHMEAGRVVTATNNCGGILGGITNGMPLLFRAAIKPTPSISAAQRSVSLARGTDEELTVKGRHDPCIVPRAVPVVEAAAAIALFDLMLEEREAFHGYY